MNYYLDDLMIDTVKMKVWRSSQSLNVSGLNFQFLSFMITKDTEVVTFEELIEGVWSPAIVTEDTVIQRVRLLRNALDDNRFEPRYIQSVRGRGYQLVAQPTTASQPRPRVWLAASVLIICLSLVASFDNFSEFSLVKDASNKGTINKFLGRAEYYASIGQKDDTDRAIELFQRVLLSEPKNTQAMIGLSRAYTVSMCRFNAHWSRAEQAEILAKKVIAIEADNFDAFRALGFSQDCRGQTFAAREAYLHAIELDPNHDIKSQSALAFLLGETGELAEALAMNLFVIHADPEQTFSLIQLARIYELLGLHPKAEPLYAQSFDLYPDNIFSNLSYPRHLFHQGKFSAARKIVAKAKTRPIHPDLLVLSAELALLDNDVAQAKKELLAAAEMRPSAEHLNILVNLYPSIQQPIDWLPQKLAALKGNSISSDPEDWLKRALIHQAIGEEQKGIKSLLSAVESGYRNKAYLKLSPFFRQLRLNPEFNNVIEGINLAVRHELDKVHASGLLTDDFELSQIKSFNPMQAKYTQVQTPAEF